MGKEIVNPFGFQSFLETYAYIYCETGAKKFIVPKINLGEFNPDNATVVLIGGMHGIEMGTEIILSTVQCLAKKDLAKNVNVIGLPCVNPYGYVYGLRSNQNGVDLIRNGPTKDPHKNNQKIWQGHNYKKLVETFRDFPFYMGASLQKENEILLRFFEEINSEKLLIIDVHSSFLFSGTKIWPAVGIRNTYFIDIIQRFIKHFDFRYEKISYKINGDIFDFIANKHPNYGAMTLEIGLLQQFVRNPLAIFNKRYRYNPIPSMRKSLLKKHRDFLLYTIEEMASQ